MVGSFVFEAAPRSGKGKGDSRRIRRENKIPAILYGGGEPVAMLFDHHAVMKSLENEAVYSHVLTIRLAGKEEKAILKDIQRHPAKPIIMHMDFQRVSATDKIRVHVPLHFINQDISVGVKKGGVVTHNVVNVDVVCLPDKLPEFIEVDLAQLDVGGSIHLSDLAIPDGVELVELSHGAEHDLAVAAIHMGRQADGEESAAG